LLIGQEGEECASFLSSGSLQCQVEIIDNPGVANHLEIFDLVFISSDLVHVIPDYFPGIMQHISNDSVMILSGIHGSRAKRAAWNKIKNQASVTLTIDLFDLGLVFCNERLTKEDFMLRYRELF
jgi:hypothetical protein